MTDTYIKKILLVEDEKSSRESTRLFLEDAGYQVLDEPSGVSALQHLNDGISAIITDLKMGGIDGLKLLETVRERASHIPVIMVTGHGSEQTAVTALKAGAFHYLTKPINPDELLHLVDQAIEKYHMSTEIARLNEQLNQQAGLHGIIGNSEIMRQVFERIRMAADTRSTVLIEGESGTGKELVAKALHNNSARQKGPFIAINCAAIPKDLIESELFGHAKGSFTGATSERVGKFLAARGGTLLIDEIGELHLDLQSKLLRVIETNQVTPLGSNNEIHTDARIIAATHRHLSDAVAAGEFREDLYYRLNVVNIALPPLRERREDIPLLVRSFIDQIAKENSRTVRDITPEALQCLQNFSWPGNVRQLRNMLESIIVLSTRDIIDLPDLPDTIRQRSSLPTVNDMIDTNMPLADIEKMAICHALNHTGGNRTEASKLLGISARTLQRRIKDYGLTI